MSTTVRVINPAADKFVQFIATKFDQTRFPNILPTALIPNPTTDGIKWPVSSAYNIETKKWETSSQTEILAGRGLRQKIAKLLPPEIGSEIMGSASNFSEWVVISGVTDPAVKMQPVALDRSAKALLQRLKIIPNDESSKRQLLTIVFEEAFTSCSEQEQLELIGRMSLCKDTLETWSFKVKFVIYKIQVVVANVFSHSIVVWTIALVVAWKSVEVYWAAKLFFDRYAKSYYFPKAINIFINHAPLEAVKVASVAAVIIQYVINHQLRISIVCWVVAAYAGTYKPYVEKVQNVILFPSRLPYMFMRPFRIFTRTFSRCAKIAKTFSTAAKEGSEKTKKKAITENVSKAYQLWMHLMQNPEGLYKKEEDRLMKT